MNLYGYGAGDPINNSDPFGLCTPWPDCMFQAAANWGASRGGAVGGAALNLAAAGNAASEAFGTNDLGRAVGEGNAAGIGLAAAGFLPVGKLGKVGRLLRDIDGGATSADAILGGASKWLGEGRSVRLICR